jgi:hypothetical protein
MTNLNSQLTEVLQGIRSEIKVDTDGKASISKYGLAKLIGVSKDNLIGDRIAKKLAEMLMELGFELGDRMFENGVPDIAVACIVKYYALYAQRTTENAKILLDAFSAVGIRVWFQEMVGFERLKPKTKLEGYKEAQKAMEELITLMEYASNKPGLENIHSFALDADSTALPGLITVDDILAQNNTEFSHREKSVIGMFASTAYRNLTGKKPDQVIKRYVDKSGKPQTTHVPGYPLDFVPVIKNAIELGFSSCVDRNN